MRQPLHLHAPRQTAKVRASADSSTSAWLHRLGLFIHSPVRVFHACASLALCKPEAQRSTTLLSTTGAGPVCFADAVPKHHNFPHIPCFPLRSTLQQETLADKVRARTWDLRDRYHRHIYGLPRALISRFQTAGVRALVDLAPPEGTRDMPTFTGGYSPPFWENPVPFRVHRAYRASCQMNRTSPPPSPCPAARSCACR